MCCSLGPDFLLRATPYLKNLDSYLPDYREEVQESTLRSGRRRPRGNRCPMLPEEGQEPHLQRGVNWNFEELKGNQRNLESL